MRRDMPIMLFFFFRFLLKLSVFCNVYWHFIIGIYNDVMKDRDLILEHGINVRFADMKCTYKVVRN